MTPINNSDLAWLIVSDYRQDHDILGAEELRDDINNPEINVWIFEDNLNLHKNYLQLEVVCNTRARVGGHVAVSGSVGAGIGIAGDNAVLSTHVGGMWEWLANDPN